MMISIHYSELPYQEKLTMILTASFNDILDLIAANVCSSIVLAERMENKLNCYKWRNGIEVGSWNIQLNPSIEYTEEELLHKIESNLEQLHENEDDPCIPMINAKKLCHSIYTISPNEYYIIPVSGRKTPLEGVFFSEIYDSFVKEWGRILLNMDEYKLFDYPDCYAAARDNVNAQDCIYNACAKILAQAGFPGGIGDCYEMQITVSILNELARVTYEQRGTNGTIVAINESVDMDQYLDVHFIKPVKFDYGRIKALRKIAEMSTEDIAIVINHDYFIGLSTRKKFDWYIRFIGNGGWNLYKGEKLILSENNGRFFLSDSPKKAFDMIQVASLQHAQNPEAIREIIEIALQQQHGTMIIFSSSIDKELVRLEKANRCTRIRPIDLIQLKKYIIPLSAIDGALMCDFDGNCHGVGAILDGVATVKGDLGRGARYNSALNYIAWKKIEHPKEEYLAAVISEDGNLNLFSTNTFNMGSLQFEEDDG